MFPRREEPREVRLLRAGRKQGAAADRRNRQTGRQGTFDHVPWCSVGARSRGRRAGASELRRQRNYHIFQPVADDEIATEMQQLPNEWYAQMGQLIDEIHDKYPERTVQAAES